MLTRCALSFSVSPCVFLCACALFFSDISSERAHELVSRGALLVDVRTDDEWRAGHIEGAIHLPLDEIARRTGELGDKGRTIIVYCHTGVRSSRAQGILQEAGFTDVHNLGGMSRW